uniref:Uncharacterized protein n=1 Tax=Monopterus albus TaxID=43700 RepID=A0A3Q3IJ60_MONAL
MFRPGSSSTHMDQLPSCSALLMLGGLRGATASDLQVYGKSIHSDKSLLSSDGGKHTVRKPLHKPTQKEIRRSLDLESFNIHVTPTTRKTNLPTIIRLYPPTAIPLHLHANMPLRFGRGSDPGDDRAPNSTPNLPQRFGRSWEFSQRCTKCPHVRDAINPVLPQRFGRNIAYWSLLRTLANQQLLNIGLRWAEDSEEEMEEKQL